jgi:hypothetical protein
VSRVCRVCGGDGVLMVEEPARDCPYCDGTGEDTSKPLPPTSPETKARYARGDVFKARVKDLKRALRETGNQPPYCSELTKDQLHRWMVEYLTPDDYVRINEALREHRKAGES